MVPKIGLDIDGVLACFPCGVIKRAQEKGIAGDFPATCRDVDQWNFSPRFMDVWEEIGDDEKFWLDLPRMPYSGPLSFQPDCYITSRRIKGHVTERWLRENGFPEAPVITTGWPLEKIPVAKERGLDLFVDDHWETVREMRREGINAVLYEAPYQRGHYIGDLPRMKSLKEIDEWIEKRPAWTQQSA